MKNRFSSEVRERMASYILGTETLEKFQGWFIPEAWERGDDADSGQLVAEIELRLAEYTSGHLSESELKADLQALLEGRAATLRNEFAYKFVLQNPAPYHVTFSTKTDLDLEHQVLTEEVFTFALADKLS